MKISRHVEDIDQRLIDSTFIRKFVTGKKDNDFNVITVARHEVSGCFRSFNKSQTQSV